MVAMLSATACGADAVASDVQVRQLVGTESVGTTYTLRDIDSAGPPAADEFVLVPGGTNSGTDPDFGDYSLTVDSFYMGRYEVTEGKWAEVRAWGLEHGYTDLAEGASDEGTDYSRGADYPVQCVSWRDVVKWLNARSEMERRTPCYTVARSYYRTGGRNDVYCDFSADGYRLPTSEEWEYAARGGLVGKRFPWGDTITHDRANYYSSSDYSYDTSSTRGYHPEYEHGGWGPCTSPVGSFAGNSYGLYDLVGNVWEWCWDWKPGGEGGYRVIRGGAYNSDTEVCRVGHVYGYSPCNRSDMYGFRACFAAPGRFGLLHPRSVPAERDAGNEGDMERGSATVAVPVTGESLSSGLEVAPSEAAPVAGQAWTVPGLGMEFVWVEPLGIWVGKFEVTNGEYRAYKASHDSSEHGGCSLNADRQPVVNVSFGDACEYAKWLTGCERAAGRVPADCVYRLPQACEWMAFAQCGDGREFPWGDSWPPTCGNYAGDEAQYPLNFIVIDRYRDGSTVTCEVERSGPNDWGLFGVGGNVYEATLRDNTTTEFDAWRGACWGDGMRDFLRCSYRNCYFAWSRLDYYGFRLVLSRSGQ
jgi:formylglycine-generating enzyme required for sulfatase activity